MGEEKKSEEVGLYEKLAHRSKELLEGAKEKTSESIDFAIDKAKEEMVAAGDFSREQGERLKTFLKRDLHIAQKYALKAGDATKEALEPHRVAVGLQNTLATILEVVGGKLEEWGEKMESQLNFKTGEITTPGTLMCKSCGADIKMHHPGHIPPCPKCKGTEFHKVY